MIPLTNTYGLYPNPQSFSSFNGICGDTNSSEILPQKMQSPPNCLKETVYWYFLHMLPTNWNVFKIPLHHLHGYKRHSKTVCNNFTLASFDNRIVGYIDSRLLKTGRCLRYNEKLNSQRPLHSTTCNTKLN